MNEQVFLDGKVREKYPLAQGYSMKLIQTYLKDNGYQYTMSGTTCNVDGYGIIKVAKGDLWTQVYNAYGDNKTSWRGTTVSKLLG